MLSSSIPASTVCEPALRGRPTLAETCDRIIGERIPNFFRLYLNPYLVQTCYCLSRYVETTWLADGPAEPGQQSFLANSFDEALSGAIKLARFGGHRAGRSPAGLVLDPSGRLGPFAGVALADGARIEFIPKLRIVNDLDAVARSGERFGFVVLVGSPERDAHALRTLVREQSPLLITCVDRPTLAAIRHGQAELLRGLTPDVVVFDESFVNHDVPFAAFTARKALFEPWNARGQATFHSTTYQPNAISSLHFLRCLQKADPDFCSTVAAALERICRDPAYCLCLFGWLYSPFLAKAIGSLGLDTLDMKTAGHYVLADGQRIFDGVAGIACSVRGHNPETYVQETTCEGDIPDYHDAVADRLKELTSLECLLPAVSGATAVENALRIGLVVQYPKRYVLAFQGGFGGKTLLALTGTAKACYKSHLDPLYEDVLYLDPTAPTILDDLETTLREYPVAVVQLELVQAVGGVRPLPPRILHYLEENKSRWGYLLFIDEVQTGMYRTGPFTRSAQLGLTPDLLTLGKAVSDMMFPFALTLYSSAVQKRLDEVQPALVPSLRRNYGYDAGYRTVHNVLARAERIDLPGRVAEASARFAATLKVSLGGCKAVRDVRVFGLLIALELNTDGWRRRFGKRLASLVLLTMLRRREFPLLIGFCQYEPSVLKLTPPLSITPEETQQVCATIAAAIKQPVWKLLLTTLGTLAKTYIQRKRRREIHV